MEQVIIVQDQNSFNPRDDQENLGTIAYKHSKYVLGDEVIDDPIDWLEDKLSVNHLGRYTNERLQELEELFFRKYVGQRLYIYDHSGITISTKPFDCRFDSGQFGYIYTTKEKIRNLLGVKNVTQKIRKRVHKFLEAEVDEFDTYLRGDVYGFEIRDENNELIDSCYGFYGVNWEENGLKDYLPEHLHPQLENAEISY